MSEYGEMQLQTEKLNLIHKHIRKLHDMFFLHKVVEELLEKDLQSALK